MPRSKHQFDEMRSKSKHKITEAALELFANEGYHHTTIKKITQKAEVSTGLLYNYFENKEELLEAIFKEGLYMVQDTMGKLLKEKEPNAKLKLMINESFRVVGGEAEHFWKLYFNLAMHPNLPTNISEIFGKFIQDAFDYITDVFRQLGYEDPEMESRIFSALGDGIMIHYWMIGEEYPLDEVVKFMHKMYKTDK